MYQELEFSNREIAQGLGVIAASVLGGVAVRNQALKVGLAAPLSFVLGLGAVAASMLVGRHLLGDSQAGEQIAAGAH